MSAASTDYFAHVGSPGTATTLSAPGHTIAGTSINVGSTSNWPTDTGVVFAIDTVTLVNGVEVRDVGSYTEWEGVVSGSVVGSLVLRYGTDQNYPSGATTRVYVPVSSSRENRLVDGISVSLDQDGTLKAGAVDSAAVLASNVVTTAKILDNNVTASKLATNAITLGAASITTPFTTTTVSSYVDVTSLTVTVTVPAGGRDVEIVVSAFMKATGIAGTGYNLAIREGSTALSNTLVNSPVSASQINMTTVCRVPAPSAGSHTYKVSIAQDTTGTASLLAGAANPAVDANGPATIVVKAI